MSESSPPESSSGSPAKAPAPDGGQPEKTLSPSERVTQAPSRLGDLVGQSVDTGDGKPFVLQHLLGYGGMGEVYLATRTVEGGAIQRVAMKVIRRDTVALRGRDPRAFLDEARLHLRLRHFNVVQVHALCEQDGVHYLVMEYLEGENLHALFEKAKRKGRRFSEAFLCYVLAKVASALHYVHHQATGADGTPLNIVHRDVSPSNVFLTKVGEPKLMDFGVAWSTVEGRLETLSAPHFYKGKRPYLSPEQTNHQEVDGRSDLFSLGCMLVEGLTGVRPFARAEHADTLAAIRNVTPEHVEAVTQGMSPGLKAICHKLLAREPSARFATGNDAANALRAHAERCGYRHDAAYVANEMAELERLPSLPPLTQVTPRRHLLRIPALMASIAVLGIFLGTAIARFTPPEDPNRYEGKAWRPARPKDKTSMQPPAPAAEVPSEEKTTVAVTPQPGRAKKSRTSAVTGSCMQALQLAGVILTASSCQVRVPTHTKTGDCTTAPTLEVKGHSIRALLKPAPGQQYVLEDVIQVAYVSLNGVGCAGEPIPHSYFPKNVPIREEPCPASDDGTIELVAQERSDYGPLSGARLYGRAHLVKEKGLIYPPLDKELREQLKADASGGVRTMGRLMVLITELRLQDNTPVPVCGVLFDARDKRIDFNRVPGIEGAAVLDPEIYGFPAIKRPMGRVKLYWPP